MSEAELTEEHKQHIIQAMQRRFGRSGADYTFSSVEEQVYRCTDNRSGAFVEARLGSLNRSSTSTRRRSWAIKVLRQGGGTVCRFLNDLVSISPVPKYLAPRDNLLHPSLISSGFEKEIVRGGYSPEKFFTGLEEIIRRRSTYELNSFRALKIIQADQRWLNGEVIAEAHCLSYTMGCWVNLLAAPISGTTDAILESYPDLSYDKGGFWVRFIEAA